MCGIKLTLDNLILKVAYRITSGESSAIIVGDHIDIQYEKCFHDDCFTVFRWRRAEDEGNVVWNFKKAEKVIDLLSNFEVAVDRYVGKRKIEELRLRIDTLIYNYGLDSYSSFFSMERYSDSWPSADKSDPHVDWRYRNLFDKDGNIKEFAISEKEEK